MKKNFGEDKEKGRILFVVSPSLIKNGIGLFLLWYTI